MELKKTTAANLEIKRGTFFQIGLIISLATVFIAFEWKQPESDNELRLQSRMEDVPEEIIPITRQDEKPPPPPPAYQFQVVNNNTQPEHEVEIEPTEITEESIVEVQPVREEKVEEPEIFLQVEEMPSFPGGEENLFKYLASHINYPGTALEKGTHGTVMLAFVVGADGQVKNVEVLRGIGDGCDEEAMRVVQNMPRWNPGKQRGKPVPVKYGIPVRFLLK